ncbi:hypothetical protein [Metaclostridioides mangenotii]|uniref:hypothetical protein n=1 Tax=Metaclostridioides mangenotii TaxID=1540 RepID=UPI000480F621|nr:hypothetical protein [Clostridioides mangenotii]
MAIIALILGTIVFWGVIKSETFVFYSFKSMGTTWMICCALSALLVGILGEGLLYLISFILPILKWVVPIGVVLFIIKLIVNKAGNIGNKEDNDVEEISIDE